MPSEPIAPVTVAPTEWPSPNFAPAHEVELKLLASKETLARLSSAPAIVRHALNRGFVRNLEAIYYDTPGHDLYRNGLSLRVRRHGRSYIQTLKRIPVAGSPFVREEWEVRVAGAEPELDQLPAGRLGDLFDIIGTQRLEAVFATKVRRRTQRLDFAGNLKPVWTN